MKYVIAASLIAVLAVGSGCQHRPHWKASKGFYTYWTAPTVRSVNTTALCSEADDMSKAVANVTFRPQ